MMTLCRNFSGFKPCSQQTGPCDQSCQSLDPIEEQILVIHLGALGSVLRSTALLAALRRKHPHSRLVWITQSPAQEFFKNLPEVDRVLTLKTEDLLEARALRYDVGYCLDKSLVAAGILQTMQVGQVFGFVAEPRSGAIVPATDHALELWDLGLDNHRKFYINQKSELELMHQSLNLGPYLRDEYKIRLGQDERILAEQKRNLWQRNKSQIVIGFNTGCSSTLPFKKWTIDYHRTLIGRLIQMGFENLVLLGGGPEDSERNLKIADGLRVHLSPCDRGLREGLTSVEACDVVISGDSLGMHMAIALKKYVVAWFGPTCSQEIDFFDRGIALKSELPCSPCWKKTCDQERLCYDHLDQQLVIKALSTGAQWIQSQRISSSCKQLFSETSSLVSPF